MGKALEKIKILDFGRVAAGPFCTLMLQNLGAEVIKVEIPKGGDTLRTFPPLTEGLEGYPFLMLNRGKKSITLNLSTSKGREIARELAKKVDVVIENFSPGVMDRQGAEESTVGSRYSHKLLLYGRGGRGAGPIGVAPSARRHSRSQVGVGRQCVLLV